MSISVIIIRRSLDTSHPRIGLASEGGGDGGEGSRRSGVYISADYEICSPAYNSRAHARVVPGGYRGLSSAIS